MTSPRDNAELAVLSRIKTLLNRARNMALDEGFDEKSSLGKALLAVHVQINLRETSLLGVAA